MSGEARSRNGHRENWPGWQVVQGNEGAKKLRLCEKQGGVTGGRGDKDAGHRGMRGTRGKR